MLSLSNAINDEEITDFYKRIKMVKQLEVDFVAEPKIDGLGVSHYIKMEY